MKKTIAAFVALVWVFTISCAPATSSRHREGDNRGQQTNLTVADEERLTQEALPKMQKDYPPSNSAELQKYISQLGMKIVTANKLEGNPYHYDFTVVDVKNVNAFAMPAGKVFVTVPLIAMASNEAELAGVVSHEIGHVVARHAAERMYAMEQAQNKTWLYAAGGGAIGAAAGLGLGLILCRDGNSSCLARAALIGGAIGAGGGLLVQKYSFLANSREDELEADRIGFKLAVGAGYDKDQVGKFYDKLLQMEKKAGNNSSALKSFADALSTHPPSEERVKQMQEMAAGSPVVKDAVVNTPAFTRAKQTAVSLAKK